MIHSILRGVITTAQGPRLLDSLIPVSMAGMAVFQDNPRRFVPYRTTAFALFFQISVIGFMFDTEHEFAN